MTFIGTLAERILSLLPSRTGRSLSEVELDPQFTLTTKIMAEHQRERHSTLSHILVSFTRILTQINEEAITPRLQDRDISSVASTLMMCKLLSSTLKREWNRGDVRGPESADYGHDFMTDYSQFHHFDLPEPLEADVCVHLVDVYVDMMSPRVVRRAFEMSGVVRPSGQEDEAIHSYLEEIDTHIGFVLRYVAAAAPDAYYGYLERHLFGHIAEATPEMLRRYTPLLRYLFYTSSVNARVVDDYTRALTHLRGSWRRVFFVFAVSSMQDQTFSRPEDYAANVSVVHGDFYAKCCALFKKACVAFDKPFSDPCSAYVVFWMATLCVEAFKEYKEIEKDREREKKDRERDRDREEKGSAEPAAVYLSSLLSEARRGTIEAFDMLLRLFHLGSQLDHAGFGEHPVARFAQRHLEPVHADLLRFGSQVRVQAQMKQPYTRNKLTLIYVNFFSAALVLRPQKYVDVLCERYRRYCADVQDIMLVVKVMRSLGESPASREVFVTLMERLAPGLKSMVYGAVKILARHERERECEGGGDETPSWYSSTSLAGAEHRITRPTELDHYLEKEKWVGMNQLVEHTEELLADIFKIFISAPQLYFEDAELMAEANMTRKTYEENASDLVQFAREVVVPLRFAFKYRVSGNGATMLFDAACDLAFNLVTPSASGTTPQNNTLVIFGKYEEANLLVQSVCEACLQLPLTNTYFRLCFLLVQQFLNDCDRFEPVMRMNAILADARVGSFVDRGTAARAAIEKVLLLSLCTHDIEFYNVARQTMRWYCEDSSIQALAARGDENLRATFARVVDDTSVFTGFASLHKKFRTILRDSRPTKSLSEVWAIVYSRWRSMLETRDLSEANLILRHYTGFLVCTAGCFFAESFAADDGDLHGRTFALISDFLDRCIALLSSADLVVRVVIKDSLSTESHPSVYHMITTKMTHIVGNYVDRSMATKENTLFLEQVLVIFSAMVGAHNDGSFVLVAQFHVVITVFVDYINQLGNTADALRLKLRFCRLGEAVESHKELNAICGCIKIRNFKAKIISEWLEQAVFFEECPAKSPKNQEMAYLSNDLAAQASKELLLNLEHLKLELPDGTIDSEIKKYKDIAFGIYFSLFYKVIDKLTGVEAPRSRNRVSLIVENLLRCMSNILQHDTDIGMQFVLLLGYHENTKIRSLFINMFSKMLMRRKKIENKEDENRKESEKEKEKEEEHIKENEKDREENDNENDKGENDKEEEYDDLFELSEAICVPGYSIVGSIADTASQTEHNLLASSLLGIYSYTGSLDRLLHELMDHEFAKIKRAADMLRRNSTLTRLLSNFTTDYGREYLEATLKPFISELVEKDVVVEVERVDSVVERDTRVYLEYLGKLIDAIYGSIDAMPPSFRFICGDIYRSVSGRFEEQALVAVGSFLFLRFLCPVIVTPDAFFKMTVGPKVKRTLMQLVKVLQNMANGSLALLKWPGLAGCTEELNKATQKVTSFLEQVSTGEVKGYAFERKTARPVAELRYLHKFIYTYVPHIKMHFLVGDSLFNSRALRKRIEVYRRFDSAVARMGLPKPSVQLQLSQSLRQEGTENQYTDFMTKMSLAYVDQKPVNLVHSSIFYDGTPVVVLNWRYFSVVDGDTHYMVFKFFEMACRVWESKFYSVVDMTEFNSSADEMVRFGELLEAHAPAQFFDNCARLYYFNLSHRVGRRISGVLRSMATSRAFRSVAVHCFSQASAPEMINRLCLEPQTMAVARDTRVEFDNCEAWDESGFRRVQVRMGRKFVQIIDTEPTEYGENRGDGGDERDDQTHSRSCVRSCRLVEIYRLSEMVKCEASEADEREFRIHLANGGEVRIRSAERQEMLRFLYYSTSRLQRKQSDVDGERELEGEHYMPWFGRLYNIVFQGMLSKDAEVKSASGLLFSSLSRFFNIDFGLVGDGLPENTSDFVKSASTHLANSYPRLSYRFFKAFFDNFDKMAPESSLASMVYLSPWVDNIYESIYLENEDKGPERVAELVRQFCRVTSSNKDHVAFLIDYVWSKLFREVRIAPILVDEVVAFAIDNKNDDPDWSFIIQVVCPSLEVCGEAISRLIACVRKSRRADSTIAEKSNLLEIRVLVKICASVFHNSYVHARLYLADIFFLATLFIDNVYLDFGADLQRLLINAIQSFLHKPDLTPAQRKVVHATTAYFSDQRAKMLFGITRDLSASGAYSTQLFNGATNFELLCDHLNDFVVQLGAGDDKSNWRSRWCSNALDVAFLADSVFQARAFLVVGILAKGGSTKSVVCTLLKLAANFDTYNVEHLTYMGVGMARVLQSFPGTSELHAVLIWPQLCFGLLNYSNLYQAAIVQLMTSVMKMTAAGIDFTEAALAQRRLLEPHVSNFEAARKIMLRRTSVSFYFFAILSRGLRVQQFKHMSLHYIKEYYKLRCRFWGPDPKSSKSTDLAAFSFSAYLPFIFLSLDDDGMDAYMCELGYPEFAYVQGSACPIPMVVVDFLANDSRGAKCCMTVASQFYNSETSTQFKLRFLSLYHLLLVVYPESALGIYHRIEQNLKLELVNSSHTQVVELVSEILVLTSTMGVRSPKEYDEELESLLMGFSLETFLYAVSPCQSDDQGIDEIAEKVRILQVMMYRVACMYVEGRSLED